MNRERKIFFDGFISRDHIYNKDFELFAIDDSTTYDIILPLKIPEAFLIKKIQWEDFSGAVQINSPWIAHTFWNINYSYNIQEKVQNKNRGASPRQSNSKEKNQVEKPLIPSRSETPKRSSSYRVRMRINSSGQYLIDKNLVYKPAQQQLVPRNQRNSSQAKPPLSHRSNSQQNINKGVKLVITVGAFLSTKSWVRYQSELLLDHERGHYLLGCLCALEFKRRAEQHIWEETEQDQLKIQVAQLFKETLNQFLEIEKQYDEETGHYIDQEMQTYWNKKIKEQLLLYNAYFSQ